MLMLLRRTNQAVIVGNKVEVKVISVSGENVLLGFNAPKTVSVHREEVYKRIIRKRNNKNLTTIIGGL